MRLIYSTVLYICTPFILLYFVFRGLKDREYLRRWKERFGLPGTSIPHGGIVIHAASVGEFNAAVPLIRALLNKYPALPLTITTFTPTGSARAQAWVDNNLRHTYVPLDLPGAVRRFFERTQPRLLIIMETELWPNLYFEAHKRNIPILMANARISARSLKTYRRFRSLTGKTLAKVAHAAAQSALDAERLIACGLAPERVYAAGNLKFDISIPDGLSDQARALREQWGPARPVLIAASTHKDDDIAVLDAFGAVLEKSANALLILVPRHPERFSAAAKLAAEKGFRVEMYSQGRACSPRAQCFVIDAMGQLLTYYACSDVAFIGGSFGSIGGHNALEASALGKAVIVGPNTENFLDVTRRLIEAGAAVRVQDAQTLGEQAARLLLDPGGTEVMGRAGKQLVEQGKGALQHTLEVINRLET